MMRFIWRFLFFSKDFFGFRFPFMPLFYSFCSSILWFCVLCADRICDIETHVWYALQAPINNCTQNRNEGADLISAFKWTYICILEHVHHETIETLKIENREKIEKHFNEPHGFTNSKLTHSSQPSLDKSYNNNDKTCLDSNVLLLS